MEKIKKILLVFILSFNLMGLNAQHGWELGGWIGTAHYFGDLNTDFDIGLPGFAAGMVARYNFNERICFKLSGNFGTVEGDDARSDNLYQKARNLSFQSSLIEGAGQLEFNFFDYVHGSKDKFFSPYLFGGIAVFSFNPKAEYKGEMVELRPLGTEGQFKGEEYYTVQGGFIYGGGFKIDINYYWSINIEIGARYLLTDYLDDVSTTYPDKDDLESLHGKTAVALSDRSIDIPDVTGSFGKPGFQRGNSTNNDSYVFSGISLVYYFGGLECPPYNR